MRKILIILLLLFGVFSTNAQIQRQILGYTLGVSTRSVVVKGLEAKVNCTPKVRHKTFGVQFNYEAFIKRKTTNYSTFDCGRANQTSGEAM